MPTALSSGSLLALPLDDRGPARDGIRAAIAPHRVAESSLPPVTYLFENQVAPP